MSASDACFMASSSTFRVALAVCIFAFLSCSARLVCACTRLRSRSAVSALKSTCNCFACCWYSFCVTLPSSRLSLSAFCLSASEVFSLVCCWSKSVFIISASISASFCAFWSASFCTSKDSPRSSACALLLVASRSAVTSSTCFW